MLAWQFAGLALLTAIAAAVQSATGFGFAVIAAPLYVLVLGPTTGIQATIGVTAVVSLVVLPKIWRAVRTPVLLRMALGSLCGIPIGVLAFRGLNPAVVRGVLGVSTLVFALAMLIANRTPLGAGSSADRTLSRTHGVLDVSAGFVSGITTALIGVSGPPIMIYLLMARLDKDQIRATLLAFFALVYVATFTVHALTVGVAPKAVAVSGTMIPCAALGAWAGNEVAGRLSQRRFEHAALGVLLIVGLATLLTG
jgi:uncharacterized membrane protein YfcA